MWELQHFGNITDEQIETANAAVSHDIAMRADVSTSAKARKSEKELKMGLKERPCFQMRDEGKCEYGDKCIFSHNPRILKENPAGMDYAHMLELFHFANVAAVLSTSRRKKLALQQTALAAALKKRSHHPNPKSYNSNNRSHSKTLREAKRSPYDTQTYQSAVKGVNANLAQHPQQQLVYYTPNMPPGEWQYPPPLDASGQTSIESDDSAIEADTGNMTEISSEEEITDDEDHQ